MIKDIALYLLVIFGLVVVSTSVHATTTKSQTNTVAVSDGNRDFNSTAITGSWGRGKK